MMILSFFLASLINVFVVESPSYAKEMVAAAHKLTAQHPELHFTIRTTEQVMQMQTADLRQSLAQASVRDRMYRRRGSEYIQLTL